MKKFSAVFLAPAILSAFGFAAQAQEQVSNDVPADLLEGPSYYNPFDCSDESQLNGSTGPLGSAFANSFWGNNECGNYDAANKSLASQEAPQTSTPFPSPDDESSFAKCYFANLPFGRLPITRYKNRLDEHKTTEYGPYVSPAQEFDKIHRVIVRICAPGLMS